MIDEFDFKLLEAYSKRDENGALVLLDDAPEDIVELAKKCLWNPYNYIINEKGEKKYCIV